jgi:hypothetical protein
LQPVELGAILGDLIEVRGLAASTRVVMNPPDDLLDGRRVREETE